MATEKRKGQDLVTLPLLSDETTRAEIDFLVTVDYRTGGGRFRFVA